MKTGYMILSAASIIPLLSSCASPQKSADTEAWSIKPTYNVRHSTETPDAYYQLGRYYQGQNRYEQALAAYQKALAVDSQFVEARNGLGVIYSMQRRFHEAIEQFRLAVEQAPNAAHIYNNLGYALYLNGLYADAAGVLKKAVDLEPSNQAAHANLALALDKAGGGEKAVQVMALAAKEQPVEHALPATPEAPQIQTGAPTPAAMPVAATKAPPSPQPQQALALPKDWGVITQATQKPVPLSVSRIQAVQLEPNVYELRERTEVRVQAVSAAKPIKQASVRPDGHGETPAQMTKQRSAPAVSLSPAPLPKGDRQTVSLREPHANDMNKVAAPAAKKPVPAADDSRVQVAQPAPRAAQQMLAAAPAAKTYRIEVSNGNGVTGMAKKVAGFLDGEGYSRARLTNQKSFQVTSSQVQYRSGYLEQAQSLVLTLPGQPGIAQANDLRGDISIRVVLGKDLAGNMANFERRQDKTRLARHGSDS